ARCLAHQPGPAGSGGAGSTGSRDPFVSSWLVVMVGAAVGGAGDRNSCGGINEIGVCGCFGLALAPDRYPHRYPPSRYLSLTEGASMREVPLVAFAAAHCDGAIVVDVLWTGGKDGGHVPVNTLLPMRQLSP